MAANPDYVTAHDIAARISVPAPLVRTWVHRGKFPEEDIKLPAVIGRPAWKWARVQPVAEALAERYRATRDASVTLNATAK